MKIQPIEESNFPQLLRIYEEGIQTGFATFETTLPSWEKWNASHLQFGRIAVFNKDLMMAWAALSPVSSRCVYGGVAEVSVYAGANYRGMGLGKILLNKLIQESESNNIWTLQSSIFRENTGSIALHEACGFRKIGYKEKVGKLHGEWRDNVLFERRSQTIGVNQKP